jgi:hypothetical protein
MWNVSVFQNWKLEQKQIVRNGWEWEWVGIGILGFWDWDFGIIFTGRYGMDTEDRDIRHNT